MNLEDFKSSLSAESPPAGLSAPLLAMWHDAKGNWELAHKTVQDEAGKNSAWVHAYLHRKEGDNSNARYWYAQAKMRMSVDTFEREWEDLVVKLFSENE